MRASGANSHTAPTHVLQIKVFRLKKFLLTQKFAGDDVGGPWLE